MYFISIVNWSDLLNYNFIMGANETGCCFRPGTGQQMPNSMYQYQQYGSQVAPPPGYEYQANYNSVTI